MTKMADSELSFQQCSFPSEFHNLPIYLQNFPSRLKTAASVDNTLRDLLNSSYPTQPHSLIAK